MILFHQPFLIFVDPWLTSWGSLEMQTQISPWLSLSSNGMAKSSSSLFASDTPAILIGQGRNIIDACMEASSSIT